jgi:adenine-specific DNA methylase
MTATIGVPTAIARRHREEPRPALVEGAPGRVPGQAAAGVHHAPDRRDEIVVDPFAGSGSTILAAEKMGRVCYAMEKSPAYVDVARERWKALHGGG